MRSQDQRPRHRERHWGLLALIAGSAVLGVLGTVAVMTLLERPAETTDEARIYDPPREVRYYAPESGRLVTYGTIRVRGSNRSGPITYVDGVRLGSRDRAGRLVVDGRGSVQEVGQPIVYVDGVRLDKGAEGVGSLDSDRIDRVEVIKGEAARRQYGEEAANGVVHVFLKSEDESGNEGEERRPSGDSR